VIHMMVSGESFVNTTGDGIEPLRVRRNGRDGADATKRAGRRVQGAERGNGMRLNVCDGAGGHTGRVYVANGRERAA